MRYTHLLLIGILVAAMSGAMLSVGLFSNIEHALEDRLFSPRPVNNNLLIVAIDTDTLTKLGGWPLKRAVFAGALKKIIAAKPRAIGIDVIFADPSRFGTEDDQVLAQTLSSSTVPITLPVEAGTLTLSGSSASSAGVLRPLPAFSGPNVHYGHVNLIRDQDGIVRRFPESVRAPEGDPIPGFAAETVSSASLGGIETIAFSGQPGTIREIPFHTLTDGTVDPSIFSGKYVFIGATASDLHDEQPTPVSEGTAMSGVEIQAQIGNMFLSGYRLSDVSFRTELLWIMVLIAIPLILFYAVRLISVAALLSLLVIPLNLVVVIILFERGFILNIVHTTLAALIATAAAFALRYFVLERERREIRSVFSKYVSKDVLEELLLDPKAVQLGGQEKVVTVLFSDIRGFTTLSEGLSPTELTTLLNRYLTAMTDIILEKKGVVDKYIGDAIMAFWGAPLANEQHALDAVLSALAMLSALDAFNAAGKERNEPAINIGVGLNTGTVVVGNMGSHQRFDYTIMGDAVNLGARLEGQTKQYGVRLLASESTILALRPDDIAAHDILIREIDKVTVKGKTEPVSIFDVVEDSRKNTVRSIIEQFNTLRTHYYDGNWKDVVKTAEAILVAHEDGPTRVLYARAQEYLTEPPKHWKGYFELTSK